MRTAWPARDRGGAGTTTNVARAGFPQAGLPTPYSLAVALSHALQPDVAARAHAVAATGAQLRVVTCACPDEDVWRQRIAARRHTGLAAHHTTTWEAVARFLTQPGVDYPITYPHLRLDTTRPLVELVSEVLAWLDETERGRGSQWKTS